ncbi:MAG TPA: DNA gyrase C-terminal beta-propeller domain-containing protein, partial [Bacteroidia bacterium]
LLEAKLTNGKCEIMLATKQGKVVRFNEETVRPMGRNASGVRGVNLDDEGGKNNEVVGMISIADPTTNVLVVSEKGFGKRSELEEYRITNRGGKGVKTINITDKTGNLVAIKEVTDNNDLMIITKNGIIIRLAVSSLRVMGRATQGVRLINLREEDEIGAVTKVDIDPEEEKNELAEQQNGEYGNEETNASTEDNTNGDQKPEDNGKEIDNPGDNNEPQ